MTGSSAERPRILQVNKFYSPHIGGVEQTVKATAEGLFEHGYDVRVLAAQSQGRGQEDRVNGISVCRTTSLGTFRSVPLAPTFPVRFRQEATVADLIHHHVPNPIGVISHLLAAPRDVPTVVTYHSDIVRQALELKLYAPLLHTFLDRVDCIFATSPNMIGNSEFLKQYEHKCRVVPLSIETSKFGQYEGASYDLPGKPGKRVLFVGRLNYYKGTEYLIDAMRDIDATLLIIGDGERRDELEARVRDHGLTDRVTFLGHVSEEKLHYCYNTADVFALPSVEASEAFGIVQLEAMAYGMPVVNTSLPTGVPWVSQDGKTGITVPPRNSSALAKALDRLLSDPEYRAELGANAATRVKTMFDRETRIDTIAAAYENILAASPTE
ncbi:MULTISPECIES: glycosyltransferase [Haloarcula]|uniref:glycosyltransferase n=1 Tax=Haloarcula TaxID=2237 RepID=UPI0023EB6C8C|nr:glycosyltransferase [Halomicroarcula sp. XH51]